MSVLLLLPALVCKAQQGAGLSPAARAAAASGNYQPALDELNAVIRQRPDDAAALTLRGNLYNKTRQPEKALEDARQARRLNAADANAVFVAGTALILLHREPEAIRYFDTALAIQPGWLQALQFRGKLLVQTGGYEAAIHDLTAVIEREPKGAEAYLLRARAYVKTSRPVPQALLDYLEVTKLAPEGSPLYGLAREEIKGPMQLYEEAKASGAPSSLLLARPGASTPVPRPEPPAGGTNPVYQRHWAALDALQDDMSAQAAAIAVARRDGDRPAFDAAKKALIRNLEQQDAIHTATLDTLRQGKEAPAPDIIRLLTDSQKSTRTLLKEAREAAL